jgi:hypothetical protein
MKKYLFLFLLLLVFAGRASADGIAAIYPAGPILTDGQFQATPCIDAIYSGLFSLCINGPAGLEVFQLGDVAEGTFNFYLNDRGEFVASWLFLDVGFGDAAGMYTGPGFQPNKDGLDYLPGSTIQSNFTNLAPNPPLLSGAPVYPGYPPQNFAPTFRPIVFTGLTDNGVVEGNEQYFYDGGKYPEVSIPVIWTFSTIPEPATLMLLIPGLLGLAAFRLKTLVLR